MKISRSSSSRGAGSPDVAGFYDDDTGSIQYIVSDPETKRSALIDVVLGFSPESASVSSENVETILRYAENEGLEIDWILDTHPHADHLMASSLLKERLKKPNGIGKRIVEIAELWRDFYNLLDAFYPEADFDHLFQDGDTFNLGRLPVQVMLSPGHTLGSITYIIGDDAAFVHDTFMQPDVGTSRTDFPGGTAADLYGSLQNIMKLPDDTRLFVGHDYGTEFRKSPEWESTVGEQRKHNAHVGGGVTEDVFIELRESRDSTLVLPDRMLHVLQMNLRAGRMPAPETGEKRFLKIPMNKF